MAQTQATETARIKFKVAELSAPGQVTRVNYNQALTEMLLGSIWIKTKTLAVPPTIVNGEGYIIATSPTGAWPNKATQMAFAINGAWVFVVPWIGITVYVEDEDKDYKYNGSTWNIKSAIQTGAFTRKMVAKTADFTASLTEAAIYRIDATSGNIVVTLPTAASAADRGWQFKRIDASGNTVTLDPNGSETIDGATTVLLATQYTSVEINSNGTSWDKLSSL